jgi:hypothetical protein
MKNGDEMLREMNKRLKRLDALVFRYGRHFKNQRLPRGYRRMRAQDCYHNAYCLLCRDPENLTYCEGYIPWTIETHAWLVDAEGNVIDPTWDFEAERKYFGVPISTAFVLETTKRVNSHDSILWELADLKPKKLAVAISHRFATR